MSPVVRQCCAVDVWLLAVMILAGSESSVLLPAAGGKGGEYVGRLCWLPHNPDLEVLEPTSSHSPLVGSSPVTHTVRGFHTEALPDSTSGAEKLQNKGEFSKEK